MSNSELVNEARKLQREYELVSIREKGIKSELQTISDQIKVLSKRRDDLIDEIEKNSLLQWEITIKLDPLEGEMLIRANV